MYSNNGSKLNKSKVLANKSAQFTLQELFIQKFYFIYLVEFHVLLQQMHFNVPQKCWQSSHSSTKMYLLCSMPGALNSAETKSLDQYKMLNNTLSPSTEYSEFKSDILTYVFVSAFSYVWQRLTPSHPEGEKHGVKVAAAKMSYCMTWNVLIGKERWGYCS